jgi:phenylacetate-CoA ligase
MPVIRYRTRDLTRLLPGEVRSMRRMEKVIGRSDDMLIIRGVNVFPTQIEEQILRCDGLGPHFVIELRREGRLDSMRVLAEARPSHADEDARTAQSKLLTSYIRNVIGLGVEVAVTEPGQIERSTGKAKRVFDLRSSLQRPST